MEQIAVNAVATSTRAALEAAMAFYERGDYTAAERLFEQALRGDPDNIQALHGSGLVALQVGDFALACDRLTRAIELGGERPGTCYLLGRAMRGLGDLEAAAACYERAVAASPGMVDAHIGLGLVLKDLGRLDDAEQSYRMALSHNTSSFEGRINLANVLQLKGRLVEAYAEYRAAAALRPSSAQAQYHLGKLERMQGRHLEAADHFQHAAHLDPDFLEAWFNFANALSSAGRFDEAIDCFRYLRGVIESGVGRPTDPAARAKLLHETMTGMAAPLTWTQRFDEALPLLNEALAREPDSLILLEYRLLILPYRCERQAEITEAYRRYQTVTPARDFRPRVDAKRTAESSRLRVGYLSGDFRDHSISFFLEPLLDNHDKGQFEVRCYSVNRQDDAATARMKTYVDAWADGADLDDDALAERISSDGVDILIDLSGRTTHNRLGVFARRAAPVQIGYLGYPTYTGIPQIAWRITDSVIDPPANEELETERPLRLPRTSLCYRPPADAPEVAQRSAGAHGHVCFGSFNQIQKLSPAIVEAWIRILKALPGSRLVLKALGFKDPKARERVFALFTNAGIFNQIQIREPMESRQHHLALYGEIDIALDTFPYNGATTTCEALWMGVPVVTLAGETHASRVGASILGVLDLPELIAESIDDYIATAVGLANDAPKLAEYRADLRQRFARSPLRDEQGFTSAFEETLRKVWSARDNLRT